MNRPIFKRELGPLSVAVFENETDSDHKPMRSISIARSYFDRQADEWKSTSASLNTADVPAMLSLLKSVEHWLLGSQKGGES